MLAKWLDFLSLLLVMCAVSQIKIKINDKKYCQKINYEDEPSM